MSITINTTENQERFADLTLEDIKTASSFSSWIKRHLLFFTGREPSDQELLIFIGYIRDRVDESDAVDGIAWKKALLELTKYLGGESEL